jgi:ABC-2 type transport system permease protein
MFADPFPFVILVGMPVILLSFLANGLVGGPAHSVPGQAALFGLFGIPVVGLAFFRDHGWGTWDRLRASTAHPAQVMTGKCLPLVALLLLQQAVLLALGRSAFGMPWHGSVAVAALLVAAIVAVEVSLALLLVTLCTSIEQLVGLGYLGAMLLSGIGGALAPLAELPDWVERIAPASPVYWALEGFHVVVAGTQPASAILAPVAVLFAFAAAAAALTAWRYRLDAPKQYFT